MNVEAIVLAGGKATRLQALDKEHPKALLQLEGRPVLEWAIARLEATSQRILVAAGKDSETIGKPFASKSGVQIIADDNLGTGNALLTAARHSTAEHVIVCNADTLNEVDIQAVLKQHLQRNRGATIVLTRDASAQNAGAFSIAKDGQIIRSLEDQQPLGRRSLNAGWRGASTGLLILPTRLLNDPRIAGALSFEQEIIPHILESEGLFAFDNGERFCLDIGTPERLAVMNKWGRKIAERLRSK